MIVNIRTQESSVVFRRSIEIAYVRASWLNYNVTPWKQEIAWFSMKTQTVWWEE